MSHFALIVVGDNIDEQLAPFAEQGFEEKYAVFNDTEDESLTDYNNEEIDIVVFADGSLHHKYEEIFRSYNKDSFSSEYNYPKDSTIRKGKFTELFSTFEDYMSAWCGNNSRDSKTYRYGYWHNPQAKWDWYSLGGRWTGYFKPKVGTSGILGKSGSFDNKPKEGWVDTILVGNIDINGMQEDAIREANETYNKIEEILLGRVYPSWNAIREKHGEDIQSARDEYNSNEVVMDFNKERFHIWGDFYEEYGNNREEYIKMSANKVGVPFAVLKDGKWYEKGEMGWFGMSNDKVSQEEWNEGFWDMFNSLPKDTQLSIVDCHI